MATETINPIDALRTATKQLTEFSKKEFEEGMTSESYSASIAGLLGYAEATLPQNDPHRKYLDSLRTHQKSLFPETKTTPTSPETTLPQEIEQALLHLEKCSAQAERIDQGFPSTQEGQDNKYLAYAQLYANFKQYQQLVPPNLPLTSTLQTRIADIGAKLDNHFRPERAIQSQTTRREPRRTRPEEHGHRVEREHTHLQEVYRRRLLMDATKTGLTVDEVMRKSPNTCWVTELPEAGQILKLSPKEKGQNHIRVVRSVLPSFADLSEAANGRGHLMLNERGEIRRQYIDKHLNAAQDLKSRSRDLYEKQGISHAEFEKMYDDLLKEIYGEVYDTPEKRATFDAERDYLRELLYNDPNNPGMKMRDNIDTINKLEAQRSRDLFSIHDTPIPEGPAFNAKEMFKQDLANALSLRSDELQAMSVPEVYEQMVLNYLKTLSRLGVSSREPEAGEIIRKISYVMTTNSFNEGERNEELRDLFKAWVDIADWNIVVDYSSSAKDLAQGSFRINPEKIQNLTNQKEELTIEIKKNDGTTESRVMTIGMGDFQDKLNEEKWSSLVFAEKGEDAGFVQHQNPQVMSERRNLLILETIQDKLDLKPGDEILSVNDIVSHKDSSGNQVSPTEYLCNEIRWAENLAYGMYQSLDKPRYNLRFTGSLKDWMGKVYQFVEYFAKYKIGPRIIGDRLRLGMTGLKEYVYGSIMSPYEEVFSPKVEANDQNGRKKFDVEINSYTKLSMRAKTAVEAIIFKMTHETETMGKNGWMRSFDETYNRLVKKQNITDKEIQVLNNYTDWSKSIKEIVAQGALVPGAQINYQGQQVYVTDLPKMGASIEKLNLSPEEVYFPEEMGRGVEGMKTFYKHMSHNYLKWNSAAKDSIGKYYGYVINADAIRGQILSGADGVALVPTFSALKKIVGQFGYLDNADQFRKIHRVIVGICQLRRGHLGLPFIGSPLEYFSHTLRNYNKADAAERAKIEQEAREGKIIICGNGDTIDQNGVLQYYKVKKSYLRGLQDVGKYFFDVEGTDRELKGRGEDKNMTAYGEAEPDLAEAMRQGAANVAGQKAVKPESERWKTVKDPLGIVSALKGKGNVGKERGWRDITEEDIDMMYHYLNQNLMTGYSRKKIASVAKEAKTSWQRTPMREIAQPILGPSKWIGEALIGR